MYICIRIQMHTYMCMCVCALCFIWSSAKLLLTVFRLHFNTVFSVVEKFHLIKQITKASQSTTAAAATGAAQPQRCCLAIFRLCALPFHFVFFFFLFFVAFCCWQNIKKEAATAEIIHKLNVLHENETIFLTETRAAVAVAAYVAARCPRSVKNNPKK